MLVKALTNISTHINVEREKRSLPYLPHYTFFTFLAMVCSVWLVRPARRDSAISSLAIFLHLYQRCSDRSTYKRGRYGGRVFLLVIVCLSVNPRVSFWYLLVFCRGSVEEGDLDEEYDDIRQYN